MQHKTSFTVPLVAAVAGTLFCAWNLLSADTVPCLTVGCSMQHDFTIGGVSLWWPGAALFAALFLCAALKKPLAGAWLCTVALLADLALLVLMLVTAPCASCLLVAFLIALSFSSFLHALRTPRRSGTPFAATCLLVVWGMLFVANAGLTLRENVAPWAISTPDGEPARANVYFSMSCQACRRLVLGMSPKDATKLAWYPVAENEEDLHAVNAMLQAMQSGLPLDIAFRNAAEAPRAYALSLRETLRLQVKLWINRSHVLLAGHNVLPFVEFFGVPDALLRKPAPQPASTLPSRTEPQSAPSKLPFINLDEAGLCTGQNSAKKSDCR